MTLAPVCTALLHGMFWCGLQQFYRVDTYLLHIEFACCTSNCHYTSIHYIEREDFPCQKTLFPKKTDIAPRQDITKMMTNSRVYANGMDGGPPDKKAFFWKFCSSCYNPLTYYGSYTGWLFCIWGSIRDQNNLLSWRKEGYLSYFPSSELLDTI